MVNTGLRNLYNKFYNIKYVSNFFMIFHVLKKMVANKKLVETTCNLDGC